MLYKEKINQGNFFVFPPEKGKAVLSHGFIALLILALSCSFGFLLTLHAGFFVMLSLADLVQNTGFGTLTLETAKSHVKRFAFFNSNFCHLFSPPSAFCKETLLSPEYNKNIINDFMRFVK